MHQNIRRDQRVKDYLAACHLVENNGSFTLLIRVDVYMTRNPLECRYWTQSYIVNEPFLFGERTQYCIQRDFTDMIYDIHVDG